jgi:hypothetical protein
MVNGVLLKRNPLGNVLGYSLIDDKKAVYKNIYINRLDKSHGKIHHNNKGPREFYI